MKKAKELLTTGPYDRIKSQGQGMYYTEWSCIRAMEEYASEYKAAYDKILEEKATDISFHYADLEKETTEKLKDQISEMIYNAIPTGQVDAFTLIKVLKQLKLDVEAL